MENSDNANCQQSESDYGEKAKIVTVNFRVSISLIFNLVYRMQK